MEDLYIQISADASGIYTAADEAKKSVNDAVASIAADGRLLDASFSEMATAVSQSMGIVDTATQAAMNKLEHLATPEQIAQFAAHEIEQGAQNVGNFLNVLGGTLATASEKMKTLQAAAEEMKTSMLTEAEQMAAYGMTLTEVNAELSATQQIMSTAAAVVSQMGSTYADTAASIDWLLEANRANAEETEQAKQRFSSLGVTLKEATANYTELESRIKAQQAEITELSTHYDTLTDALAQAEEQGDTWQIDAITAQLVALRGEIVNETAELQNMQGALANVKSNIEELGGEAPNTEGKLTSLIKAAEVGFKMLPKPLQQAVSGIKEMTAAAMKFIKTPVGAIITAIVVALTLLYKAFTKSASGQKLLAMGGAFLSTIFESLSKMITPLLDWLLKLFTEPQEAVKDLGNMIGGWFKRTLTALGDTASGLGKLLAAVFMPSKNWAQNIKNAWGEFTGALKNFVMENPVVKLHKMAFEATVGAVKDGIAAAKNELAKAELEEKRSQERVETEKRNGEMINAQQKMRDASLTPEERKKAVEEYARLSNQQKEADLALAKEELRIHEEKMRITQTGIQDLVKQNELKANILKIENEHNRRLVATQRITNGINSKITANAKAAERANAKEQKAAERANAKEQKAAERANAKEQKAAEKRIQNYLKAEELLEKLNIDNAKDEAGNERRAYNAEAKLHTDNIREQIKDIKKNAKIAKDERNAIYLDRLREIDKQEAELEKRRKNSGEAGLTEEDKKALQQARALAADALFYDNAIINAQEQAQIEKLTDELIQTYGNYYEKRAQLAQKWEEKIAKIPDEYKEGATKQMNKELSAMDISELKNSDLYVAAFDNLQGVGAPALEILIQKMQKLREETAQMSPEQLREYNKQLEALQDALQATQTHYTNIKEARKAYAQAVQEVAQARQEEKDAIVSLNAAQVGLNIAIQQEQNATSEDQKAAAKQRIAEATKRVTSAENTLAKAIQNTSKKVKQSDTTYNALQSHQQKSIQVWKKSADIIKQVGSMMKGTAGEALKLVGDVMSTAIDITSTIKDTVSTASQAMTTTAATAATAISTVEKASVILAVISAALQIAMAIANLFTGNEQKKHEEQMKQYKQQLEDLERAYAKLEKQVENSYSSQKRHAIEMQIANKQAQAEIIRSEIAAERSRKKKKQDEDAIHEAEEKLKDISDDISDLRTAAKDAIFGNDVKSAIEDFADAYAEAWAAGTSRKKSAKDIVRSQIKDVVVETIKMLASPEIEKVRKMITDFMADGYISDEEMAQLNTAAEGIANYLDKSVGNVSKFLQDTATDEATSKGFAGASEDEIGELNGRFAAIQINTSILADACTQNMGAFQALANATQMTAGILNDMRDLDALRNDYLTTLRDNSNTLTRLLSSRIASIDEKLSRL